MMDSTEREIFADAVQRAASQATGAGLDEALEAIGWADALGVDEQVAVGTLFEAQGAVAATSSALGQVLLAHLGIDDGGDRAVILPALGTAQVPAHTAIGEGAGGGKGTNGRDGHGPCVALRGLGTSDLRRRAIATVLAERDGSLWSAAVDTADLSVREVEGLDPALGLCEVESDCVRARDGWAPVGDAAGSSGSWDEAVAAARLALGHEMLGAMRTMLALAREHSLERVQFGRPISGFQAVRHRLAESLVAIEAAESALEGAWQDRSPFTAKLAKAVAGNSAKVVRRHTQQVLAGIGFTVEHDLHLYIRRTMVLDSLLGDARSLTEEIGAELLDRGGVPALLPL